MATYYENLGVSPQASADEIHDAYRFLAQKFHPDANPGNEEFARKRFQVIQEAFETLSDPQLRGEYDAKLAAGLGPEWEPITMDTANGGVKFNSDGSFDVGGLHIAANAGAPKTQVGNSWFEKDAGSRGELRVFSKGKIHYFRFGNMQWHAKRDKPSRTGGEKKPSSPKPAPSPSPMNVPSRHTADFPQRIGNGPTRGSHPLARSFRRLVLAGLLLAVGVGGGYFASRSGTLSLPLTNEELIAQKQAELQQRAALSDLETKLAQQATEETRRLQDKTLQRDQLLEVKRVGESASASIDELIQETKRWDEQVIPLLTNDAGRKISNSVDRIRLFKSIYEKPRTSTPEAQSMRDEVLSLCKPLEQALTNEDSSFPAFDALKERLLAKRASADQLAGDLRVNRTIALNLVANSEPNASGEKTLEEALNALEGEAMQREAELVARQEQAAREAASEKLAETRQQLVEAQAKEERQRVASEAEALQQKVQHEADLVEAKTRKVQQALSFFLTPGYYQPGGRNKNYTRTIKPRPISYSKLLEQGALEPTNHGIEQLQKVVTRFPEDLRTNWNIPPDAFQLGPQTTKQLADAQDYLRRLGPALVELEMLDP